MTTEESRAAAGPPEGDGVLDQPVVPATWLPRGLADAVDAALVRLSRAGVRRGDRIVLDTPDRSRWAVLPQLLAADRLGAACLVADPGWSPRERAAVLADAAPRFVVPVDGTVPDPAPGTDIPPPTGTFLLPTTSGSTTTPSVLARTRESWRIGFDALGALPGPVLVPGSPSSTLFLFGALHALHHGLGVVTRGHLEPTDVPDRGTVHLVPAQLSALLDDHERWPGNPAPSVIVCGGAHVAPAVRERCTRLLPDTRLVEYYGSAEHSLIAIRRRGGALLPVEDVRLEVRDGVLWVDSPQSVLGRLRAGVLEPLPRPSTVGDRATIDDDGALTVLGRSATAISSGGTLVAAEEVEQVLRAVPGVADVVVAGTPHPSLGMLVTAVVEPRDGATVHRRALRDAARAALAPAKRPRRWLVTGALPRLGSGKPARSAIADGLRDNDLDAHPFDDRPGP